MDYEWNRRIVLSLSVMLLFLLSVSLVKAQVSIDNIELPSSIEENTLLTTTFDVSTDSDSSIIYHIYMDGILVSNNNSYSRFMNYSSAGTYLFTFVAYDDNSTVSENQSLEVNDVPLTLTLASPLNVTYNSRTLNITLALSTYADGCIYSTNNSGAGSGYLDGSFNSFHKSITFDSDGIYSLSINCSNAFDTSSVSSSFVINTVNPVILSKSVSIDANNAVTINAATDTSCTCRYSPSDMSYDSMPYTFSNTNNVQHSTALSGLGDGSYTYFIRCRSLLNNNVVLSAETASFDIINKPSASISLSQSSPLKAGTYEINLLTSKSVQNSPTLYYTLDNDQTTRYISLTGSGTNWNGYMIVDDGVGNRVGTFHFSGEDYNNNVGTIITQNSVFLIDTDKPIAPTSAEAVARDDGSIKLKWYYDGKEVTKYDIYRSTTSDVDYVDYYDTSNSMQYTDNDVIDGVTYYYRIAAIDKADNDGVLSTVIQATSEKKYSSSSSDNISSVAQSMDSQLIPKIDQQVVEFQKFLMDIDTARTELGKINDPSKLKIINILNLNDKITTAEKTINGLIDQANALKNQNLQASELDVRLNKLRLDAIKAETDVTEDIVVSEESTYSQITQESDVDQAITAVTENYNLSRKTLDNYTLANKQLQDSVSVNSEIMIFKIQYLGKDDYDKYTLVTKTVKANPGLDGVIILESIPKDVDSKASDVIFNIDNQDAPTVVKDDPVVQWDAPTLNSKTIYYMINSNADMSSAKNAKTVVLIKPEFKFTESLKDPTVNGLTGFIGLDTVNIFNISPIQWAILLGVGLIACLSIYYVTLDGREKKKNLQRLKDHKIVTLHAAKNTVAKITATSKVISKPVAYFDINKSLEEANVMINSFNYERARMMYNDCIEKFNQISFRSAAEKRDVRQMLNHLYVKLSAYRVIYQSRKHLNSKDYASVREDITNINSVCAKLMANLSSIDQDNKDTERKFIDYIINSRKHLESVTS